MLKNYFKIAFRNLWKHRVFSFINITGLAVGMTACFLIFLYVKFELSYDSFHSKADRVYRMVCDIKTPTETINAAATAWAMAPNVQNDFPEVESFVRITDANLLVTKGELKFQEENSLWVDSAFFRVFDFKLVQGNPATALKAPYSIVLSQSAARKYFGNEDPVGQTLMLPRNDTVPAATVTGIMEDIPENSQIKADMLVSMSTLTTSIAPGLDEQWANFGSTAYLLLKPGTSDKALEAKLPAFLERRTGKQMEELQMYYTLFLEPLKEVYLYSKRGGFETGSIQNVTIFSIIALLIVLIACFNFINLTTARAVERAREVGIRKVAGAVKKQLTLQFIGESVLLCLMAFVLTVIFSALLMPVFNHLAGKTIPYNLLGDGYPLLTLLLAAIGIGLLAGSYPAWVLSSFRPVTVLKGRFATSTKGIILRKGLVVAQFTISLALIATTMIVYRQLNYMRNQDLGFQKDRMMVIDTKGDRGKEAFKQAVESVPGVNRAAMSSSIPGSGNSAAYSEIENMQGDLQIANLDLYFVDFDYIDQYKMKMAAGRSFSKGFATDTTDAMILNETAVRLFGYNDPEQAIGKRFKQWGREGKIIGVVKDFHFRSLQENIKPLSIRMDRPGAWNLLSVDVSAASLPATIAAIENAWNRTIPNRPFSYNFLDESFDRQYRSEERFGSLFFNFSILAIFISCLGLLGLASYSTLQRTKEIGIRKVMGASVTSVVVLLSRDFIKLVGLALLIAVPLVWYFMGKWLEGFAYGTNIAWWIFAVAGLLALTIALLTISYQSVKAALANPVQSLRSE